jgi:hypothetical protein
MKPFRICIALALTLPCAWAQEAQKEDLTTVLAAVREKEKDVKSAIVEMRNQSVFPDGSVFEALGTLRLDGRTHFHSSMRLLLGKEVMSETELVHTPKGVWMRERDPMQGEVFLTIDPKLVQQLKEAAELLETGSPVTAFDNRNEAPLGSALLTDMAEQFDLAVASSTIDGVEYWVLKGAPRPGVTAPEEADIPRPDLVELRVRKSDGLVARMAQSRQGKAFLTVEIVKYERNPTLDPASFAIALPTGQRWKDVREHGPAFAQIQATLKEAEAARKEKEAGAKKTETDPPKSDAEKRDGKDGRD